MKFSFPESRSPMPESPYLSPIERIFPCQKSGVCWPLIHFSWDEEVLELQVEGPGSTTRLYSSRVPSGPRGGSSRTRNGVGVVLRT